jgi:hypothetical protein
VNFFFDSDSKDPAAAIYDGNDSIFTRTGGGGAI